VATGLVRRQPYGHADEFDPGRGHHAELDPGRGRFAGVTFYALLALFPGIAALVSVYGLFADPSTIVNHLDAISGFAPGGAVDVMREQLTRLAEQGSTTLGISFIVSLLISLWSANSGIKALFDALNVVYQEKEKRNFIRLNAVTLCFTVATIAFLLIALVGIVALPVIVNYLPLSENRQVAGPAGARRVRAHFDLSIWSEPDKTALAMDYLGQRVCSDHLACRFGSLLVVCSKYREILVKRRGSSLINGGSFLWVLITCLPDLLAAPQWRAAVHDCAAGRATPPKSGPSSWGRLLVLLIPFLRSRFRAIPCRGFAAAAGGQGAGRRRDGAAAGSGQGQCRTRPRPAMPSAGEDGDPRHRRHGDRLRQTGGQACL
jgi:hypothetical protein